MPSMGRERCASYAVQGSPPVSLTRWERSGNENTRVSINMKNIKAMLSSEDMTWGTPQAFFDDLDKEFNFTLDPCATPETAKCEKFFTPEIDGLKQSWDGFNVFCNPPYGSEIKHWVKKASETRGGVVVMLIPARTDTRYFHDYIYQKEGVEIRFIKGRLKFEGPNRFWHNQWVRQNVLHRRLD